MVLWPRPRNLLWCFLPEKLYCINFVQDLCLTGLHSLHFVEELMLKRLLILSILLVEQNPSGLASCFCPCINALVSGSLNSHLMEVFTFSNFGYLFSSYDEQLGRLLAGFLSRECEMVLYFLNFCPVSVLSCMFWHVLVVLLKYMQILCGGFPSM